MVHLHFLFRVQEPWVSVAGIVSCISSNVEFVNGLNPGVMS